jgi:hypothetical protein
MHTTQYITNQIKSPLLRSIQGTDSHTILYSLRVSLLLPHFDNCVILESNLVSIYEFLACQRVSYLYQYIGGYCSQECHYMTGTTKSGQAYVIKASAYITLIRIQMLHVFIYDHWCALSRVNAPGKLQIKLCELEKMRIELRLGASFSFFVTLIHIIIL